ncbi:hypothetical protein ACOME3_005196 [Neoechinorhynchus agilis]
MKSKLREKLKLKKNTEQTGTDEKDKLNEQNVEIIKSVGVFELFRFADRLDRLLMILGTLFGISQAITQVFWLRQFRTCVNEFTGYVISREILIAANESLDELNSEFRRDILHQGVAYFLGLGAANVLLVFISTFAWAQTADRQIIRIRFLAFKSMMQQEIGWFDMRSPGDLVNRLAEDVQRIREGFGEKVADTFLLLSRSIGGILIALIEGWKMSLVFMCFTPLVGLSLAILIITLKKFTEKEMNEYAQANSIADEVLGAIRTVVAFGGQKRDSQRYTASLESAKKVGIKKGLYIGVCQLGVNIFLYTSFAVLVWYGPLLVRTDNAYSPGTVMLVFMGILSSTFMIAAVAPNLQSFAEARGSAGKLYEIIDKESLINPMADEGECPDSVRGDINFHNVDFHYPARTEAKILNQLFLHIPAGNTVALVGPSGCGKSTIIQLVQRFYDPENGAVLLDDKDIRSLNVSWLRSNIGVVSQEPVLFYGTVSENIRLGKVNATQSEIEEAARRANAHDFIMSLPNGYDTMIGERGATLSGGQKQRVAIARAVISNPPILLLDEATSALDTESERLVQKALDDARHNRTTIVVAHRLSTIQNADIIYVFEQGRIVETGTHAELMNNRQLYYELVTAQTVAPTGEQQKSVPYHYIPPTEKMASLDYPTEIDTDYDDEDDEDQAIKSRTATLLSVPSKDAPVKSTKKVRISLI